LGFLNKILETNPKARGILFETEKVALELLKCNSNIEIITGNFFEALPQADLFIMKNILHDWGDQKALEILQNCRKSMTLGTKLLIIESVIDENSSKVELFYDLHMHVLLGGNERSRV
jgi:hypothetical protein